VRNPNELWINLNHPCCGVDVATWEQGGWETAEQALRNGYESLESIRSTQRSRLELLEVCKSLMATCDSAPPMEFIARIGVVCDAARIAIAKAEGRKVVVIDGKEYTPDYPQCQGCENLAVGNGWECIYKLGTSECEYPETFAG